MSDALELSAEMRERAGKGASRALRREGRVPAVIYGGKEEPTTIHIGEKELRKQLGTGHFMNSIVMIDLGGDTLRTIPKDVSLDPVTDRPIHVDFLRLSKDAKIQVAVPVVFVNEEESPGLKKGGVLNVVRHDLELVCENAKIPSEIAIDVTGLEIGDSIHISSVTLPDGAESAITDRDFTIATLVAPSALKRAEGEAGDDQTGEGIEPGETAATELGPDADAAAEQEAKSE
ncbi:50S ribosomal protein L25/general stress protein Ctc [Erythrobacter arachoides]|uniref:Large ribosomal subunit protein bL25 n=1 Tax=Aurantiacibacter arachoides TaxID=1850444 RepID=A0A844ZXX3_9SPHN|nr:50S ribosomal protein L25/general stress protein Ctc [Aurantiacibacter arachoides]MXO93141.1 50S ribosomal protein L25/general stress protein Ctc [Aurantiacibacter arachoides]GGD51739.1 50S ribosomal protein L25 [Aurantiacibacter arachoides]